VAVTPPVPVGDADGDVDREGDVEGDADREGDAEGDADREGDAVADAAADDDAMVDGDPLAWGTNSSEYRANAIAMSACAQNRW